MSALAVIAALLLEQWRPLGERKTYFALLASGAEWLERSFNAGEGRQGAIAWLVAVLPVLAAAMVLYGVLLWIHRHRAARRQGLPRHGAGRGCRATRLQIDAYRLRRWTSVSCCSWPSTRRSPV
jgi:hypothetical protein